MSDESIFAAALSKAPGAERCIGREASANAGSIGKSRFKLQT
jgi:hypothetical protein